MWGGEGGEGGEGGSDTNHGSGAELSLALPSQ